MYVRAKHRGDLTYFYLVESRRVGGKVRQRVIAYLGRSPSKAAIRRAMGKARKGRRGAA